MKIEVNPIGVPVPTPSPYQNDPGTGLSAPQSDSVRETDVTGKTAKTSDTETKLSKNHVQYSKVIGANDQAQAVARQIREVDETMRQVEGHVQQMKTTLEDVVKVFPPYPKESTERIEALKQFSSIRKMIDQLTFPPPDDSPAKILGDPQASDQAGDWQLENGKGRQVSLTIQRQPIHTGAGGLDIPALSTDASDDQLHQAVGRLGQAQKTVASRHQDFVSDANRVIKALL